ncbi:MAG: response regulator [Bacteroidales bacterium]|nr:response regulator [Bacteroidales bacterium]
MSRIKILIVEDELIIAEDMKGMLLELDYEVTGVACDTKEAMEMLSLDMPDIALIDIKLRRGDDGISLGKTVKEKYSIPIIFITSHSDKSTVEKAKQVKPEGYIVKPFEKDDLFTSIEIAIFNNVSDKNRPDQANISENSVINDSIFIRKDYMMIKIRFEDLVWFKSDDNYLELYCREAKHLVRSTLKEFIEKLPSAIFLQVHKSYGININYVTAIDYNSIWLKNIQIPIGRSHIENIKKAMKIDLWPKSL